MTVRPPAAGSGPSRIPPRTVPPRWQGDPDHRPPTDAEQVRARVRNRSLARFAAVFLLLLSAGFVMSPTPALLRLSQLLPPFARFAIPLGLVLERVYPFIQSGLVLLLSYVCIHLTIGAVLLVVQVRTRRRQQHNTFLLELPRALPGELGRGVDLFAGIGDALSALGRERGREDTLVFAMHAGSAGDRVRLSVRTPARSGAEPLAEAVCARIAGCAPGTTTTPTPDDLLAALHDGTGGFAGWAEYVLLRQPPYPLKDLAMFVGGDPLGPLAAALSRQDGVRYAAFEVIIRALGRREDWRAPLRERIALIQGTLSPEDLAAYEALNRKVEGPGFDVVVRSCVVADTPQAVRSQLRTMEHALLALSRPSGDARQRLFRRGSRVPDRWPGFSTVPLTPETTGREPLPKWDRVTFAAGISVALAGALVGTLPVDWLLPGIYIPPSLFAVVSIPAALVVSLLSMLWPLAGLLLALWCSPRRRAARARDRLATMAAHAHLPFWPGSRWTLFPAPAKARAVMGPYELAALWHPPALDLEATFDWRSTRYLPAPAVAFLDTEEAAASEARQVIPRPATPPELGAVRLGLAYARQRDGTLGLVGPTLRDLRQGWDTLGATGSGKSSLVETMVLEIVRQGGGCGVIDAKGDLCDRLLRILPPECHERVIVIDTTAECVPCINPFDRRLVGNKARDVVAGELGQIFARIEPEIWAGALGMQQALFMGVSAVLEGEPTPTLLHLERLYLSPRYRDEVLGRVVDRAVRDYWLVQVPSMPEKIKTSIDSLKRRLTGLVGSETGQRLLCQPHSTIDLPRAMREQAIVIIKLVPERIGETNAAFWGAALFQSVVSATFSQQQEPDPDERWDWPLFVDEVQVFVKAERADDAERMWTRTRSMGVGLVGAHQGLNQLGETLGGTVMNVLGGLCLTSGVRDDPRDLVLAYANQGILPEDLAGLRAREELLIRFPVRGRDTGLFSAVPRSRPPEQSSKRAHTARSTERFQPASEEEALDLATLEALEQGVAQMLKTNAELLPETVYRAVANEWVSAVENEFRQRSTGGNTDTWIEIAAIVERLRNVSRRRAHDEVAELFERPHTLPAGDYLTRLSAARYGVDPLVNACYVAVLVRRYPADERGAVPARGKRRQHEEPAVAPAALPERPTAGR